MTTRDQVTGMVLGLAIGDALGVPYEFRQRESLRAQPITGMDGYGAHQQPPGTWSDDTSLTALLIESLVAQPVATPPYVDIVDLGHRFVDWHDHGTWTARGQVFDIGMTTRAAILAIASELEPYDPTEFNDQTQGNGSLMRILPMALWVPPVDDRTLYRAVHEVSAITHGHPVCAVACYLWVAYARQVLATGNLAAAYQALCTHSPAVLAQLEVPAAVRAPFERVLGGQLDHVPEPAIESTGWVVHTLEAALWCLLRTTDSRSAILAAVNLGDDADTTGSVVGGLAGLHYGAASLPADWREALARQDDLVALAERFHQALQRQQAAG